MTTEQTDEQTSAGALVAQPSALTGKRANWTIAHKIDQENNSIVFSVKGAGELRLVLGTVHAENLKRATLHGFVQRISDAAAMARDSKTGASATPQQKFEAMKRLVEHYASGSEEWSPARSSEGGAGRVKSENPNARLLRAALKIFNPQKSEETIAQFVKERNAAQITALILSENLKEAVELAREQLSEEDAKMAEGVDAEELLSGL